MMIGFWVTSDLNDIVGDEIDGIPIYEIFEESDARDTLYHRVGDAGAGYVEVT
jgi:hypothetical protein